MSRCAGPTGLSDATHAASPAASEGSGPDARTQEEDDARFPRCPSGYAQGRRSRPCGLPAVPSAQDAASCLPQLRILRRERDHRHRVAAAAPATRRDRPFLVRRSLVLEESVTPRSTAVTDASRDATAVGRLLFDSLRSDSLDHPLHPVDPAPDPESGSRSRPHVRAEWHLCALRAGASRRYGPAVPRDRADQDSTPTAVGDHTQSAVALDTRSGIGGRP